MNIQKPFIGIAAALLISACSTTPVTEQLAAPVPAERIYKASYMGAASAASDATVVFLRDSGLFGSGCSHDLYVDGTKVFAIQRGEKITIHIASGQRVFRLETGGGLCPNVATSQETTIAAGSRQVYRILLPSDGSLRLTRIE